MLSALVIILCPFIVIAFYNIIFRFLKCSYQFSIQLCATKPINLKEKFGEWAVITGSTDGVGKEYAKELARRDVNIVLISRSLDKLNNVKNEIQKINPSVEVKVIQANLSEGINVFKNIELELNSLPVGILVNNVGRINDYPMYLGEIPEEDLWDIINLNISATTFMTRMLIEKMKKQGRGAIINISSGASLMPLPLMAVYSASKIFVTYFSEAIRAEYSKYGVTVQCLSPFYINTRMVGYSERIMASRMCPDPDIYVKSAIETLGRIDSTAGYWIHEIQIFFTLLVPMWLRTKIGFEINKSTRNEYFSNQKNKLE